MNKKNIFYKIGFNTAIQFVGKFISAVLGLLTVGMLTRYLGTSGYGNFTLVFSYMSFFSIFADFGLQLTIIRELSTKQLDSEKIYGTYFWLKFFLIIISTLLAVVALLFFPYSTTLKFGILIGALAVGVGSLSGYGTAIFQSNIRLDLVTFIDIISKIITVIFIASFVFYKLNFYWIISTVLIGNLSGLLITIILLKKFIHFNFLFDKETAGKIVKWSVPIGLTSFFSLAYFKLDTIMLSLLRSSEEVGIYSLSYKILENILVLWGMYMASVYPIFAKFIAEKNIDKFKNVFKKTLYTAVILSTLILTVSFIFTPFFIRFFGGSEFRASIIPFRILLFSVPIYFITNSFYNLFLSDKKVKTVIYLMIIGLLFNFSTNLFLIPNMGYIGASITTVVTELIVLLGYLFFWVKNKNINKITINS